MTRKVHCILLIDDNKYDNYYHERVIKNHHSADVIIAKESALEALDYLKNKDEQRGPQPDIIFLDINMPGMDGWEFLQEYEDLHISQKGRVVVIMLTTSENPDHQAKASMISAITEYRTKPLTDEILDEIIGKYF